MTRNRHLPPWAAGLIALVAVAVVAALRLGFFAPDPLVATIPLSSDIVAAAGNASGLFAVADG